MSVVKKNQTVPDSCLDFLLIEIVRNYSGKGLEFRPAATLEALGFRIGKQLVER